jgi:hypothetical protein
VRGDQQQQQAPVAAEKQRRAMRLRMSLSTRWAIDLMRRLSKRCSSYHSNIGRPADLVNEMAIHICRTDACTFLLAQAAATGIISR